MPSTTETPTRRRQPGATARLASPPPRPTLAEQDEFVRALWYGPPGYMKTTCAATMACLGRIIYIDAEQRLKPTPLRRVGEKLGLEIPIENIEPHTAVDYKSLLALTEEVRDRLAEGEPIVGVVLDSISEQHRELLEDAVDESVQRAVAKGEYRSPIRTFQEDYGDMTEQMRRILRRFRALPVHLGITALPRTDVVQGVNYTSAGVTPAVNRDLQAMVDFIIYMGYESFSDADGDDEYSGRCRATGPFDAKDTFGVLPTRLVEPHFMRLLAYVNGELTPKTDPLQAAARERRQRLAAEQSSQAKTAIKEET